jgi:hypothetical protein
MWSGLAYVGRLSMGGCIAVQFRALLVGAVVGAIFTIIIHKLSLTTGIIPSFNIAAGLLGFIFIKGWVSFLKLFKFTPHDFTPQVRWGPHIARPAHCRYLRRACCLADYPSCLLKLPARSWRNEVAVEVYRNIG